LGFACATAIRPDILIVDEVLAVGDSNFARKCLERIGVLKQNGTTFILVSHDAHTVRSFCDRGIVLDSGTMQFDGPVHEALKVQEEIMDRRYLANLSEEQRAETLRLRELEQNEAARDLASRPSVACRYWTESRGQPTGTLESATPFAVVAEIKVNESAKLLGNLNVGFSFITPNGLRVTGMNLGQKLGTIDPVRIQEGRPFRIRFDFADGIPTLASGQYFLVISVMDSENARHLVHMDPVAVQFVSDADRNNFDGDVLSLRQLTVQAQVVPVE
jgi:ABC-type glutathione transport system ATPase component